MFFVYFLAILTAIVASCGFFAWPLPTKAPLPRKNILFGLAIFACSHVLAQIFAYGVLALVLFAGYLSILPYTWVRSILYSGSKPIANLYQAIGSGIRMGVITIPITQLLGLEIREILLFFFPPETLQEQILVQELQAGPVDIQSFLCLGILIPIVEELFFRGIVQTVLKNHIPRGYALLCTSLAFTLAHAEPFLGGLVYLSVLFIFSLAAGFIYEKERNIAAPIALHMMFNMSQFAILLYAKA